MVRINTNIGALMSARASKSVQRKVDDASLRLSTGKRVNASADDAAGLAVANKMFSQIRGMKTAYKNTADGISLLQTAIAGMQSSLDIVQRLRELAIQSHNGVYVDGDRGNLQVEADSLLGELNRIAANTKFNDVNLLDGSYSKDMRVGNTNSEIVNVTIDGMGINKHIKGESYATGSSTQILSPLEYAFGVSDFDNLASSRANGEMSPRFLDSAIAMGSSSFNLPANSSGSVVSSNPAYLSESSATGASQANVPGSSNATGTSAAYYKSSTNAEIRSLSTISSNSRYTAVGFQNGDFSDGSYTQSGNVVSIPGWDITLGPIELGPDDGPYDDSIAGWATPIDNKTPDVMQSGTDAPYDHRPPSNRTKNYPNVYVGEPGTSGTPIYDWDVDNGELMLFTNGFNLPSYGIHHGPFVVSQSSVSLEVGDSVSFEWYGMSGGDAYDIYGYLLNEDTGETIELVNESGIESGSSEDFYPYTAGQTASAGWVTENTVVSNAGNYKFVFISGTYDYSGGQYVGNGMRIRNVDVQQANPPPANELRASVTLQAVESDEIRIDHSLLNSAVESALADPNGVYSILAEGADYGKFTIDPATGNITSQSLRYNDQQTYQFKVLYVGPNGTEHTETVNLNLTPRDEAFTTSSAPESGRVSLDQHQFSTFQDFFDFENARGMADDLTYSLSSYSDNDSNPLNDGDPLDFQAFSINQNTGEITSNNGLDFSSKSTWQFNAIATARDGRTFTNHIILNLEDTLSSTANLTVEETNRIKVDIPSLTGSSEFAARYSPGTYSLPPGRVDNSYFSIIGNEIVGDFNFRIPNKSTYNLELMYTSGGVQHIEYISIDLTRFLQSDSNLTAQEANRVEFSVNDLSHITDFASDDGYNGSWRIERYDNEDGNSSNDGDGDDHNFFAIDANSLTVYSRFPLDYTVENEFHFNLVYRASNGTEFTDRIILNLEDTLSSTALFEVEEANQIVLNISDISASNTYAGLNTGGTFSIGAGSDIFQIIGNQIIANGEFRRETRDSYNFELIYEHGGVRHVEDVTVNLTQFMQSEGVFTALESDRVIIESDGFVFLDDFASANPNGRYQLSGPDASLFAVSETGDIYSINPLDYDTQQSYRLNLDYTVGGKTFSSEITLGLEDTLAASSTLYCEEAQEIIVQGSLMASLNAYAAKDSGQGYFVLLEQGDYDKFTMASDGTLTSIGELRMADDPVLDLYIRYESPTIDSLVEHIQINLTPTSYDHSRSDFEASESGEVVIVPQLNQYLEAYAAADNYAGYFELADSPYATERDYLQFDIDATGQIRSKNRMDFESGRTQYEVTVYYHHSSGTRHYTDYRRLEITNDKRDDNNLALEGIDISTREGAAAAAELLNEVIVRISSSQAKLGAIENRFTHNIDMLGLNILMSEQANGRIIDADYATESTKLARSQILEQAATNMLVNANQAKQNILLLIE